METVTAYSEKIEIVYALVINGMLGIAVARYIAAFLTPKKHRRLFAACIVGVTFFATGYISAIVPWSYGYWTSVKGIAALSLLFAVTSLLYRSEPLKQIFLLFSFHTVMRICNTFMTFLGNALYPEDRIVDTIFGLPDLPQERLYLYLKLSFAARYAFNALVFGLLLFLCLRGIAKGYTFKTRSLGAAETMLMLLPCVTVFVITGMVSVFIGNAQVSGDDAMLLIRSFYDSYLGLISLALIFLLFTLIFSVRMVQRSARLHMEATDAAILKEQMREIQKRDDGGIYAEIRGMRHDMKNHLGNMNALLASATNGSLKSATELGAYVAKMNDTLDQFEFAFQTGSAVLDAVIHGRYLTAKRKSVRFSVEFCFPESSGIDAYDLAVILQNALDNACEACEAVPEGKRFINLRSSVKAATLFVEIGNSYAGVIVFDTQTGLPLTAKQDDGEHGLGVSNIKRAAEKYGGDIDIKLSEENGTKIFTLTVVLPFRYAG